MRFFDIDGTDITEVLEKETAEAGQPFAFGAATVPEYLAHFVNTGLLVPTADPKVFINSNTIEGVMVLDEETGTVRVAKDPTILKARVIDIAEKTQAVLDGEESDVSSDAIMAAGNWIFSAERTPEEFNLLSDMQRNAIMIAGMRITLGAL